jgi:hypothetical protein
MLNEDVTYPVLLTSVEVVFMGEVAARVLLASVDVVFGRRVVEAVLLASIEVAAVSEVEDTTSLANINVMFGIKVGAAAISLAMVAVVSTSGVRDTVELNKDVVLASNFGAADGVSLTTGGRATTPVALSKAFSGDAQDDNKGKTAVKMFCSIPIALNGGGSSGKETSRAMSIERETFASTKARGPNLMSSGDSSAVWFANGASGTVALLLSPQFSAILLDSFASRRGKFKEGVTSAFS